MQELGIASTGELYALVLGRRAAKQLSTLPHLRELRTTGVSELTGGYGLSDTAAVKVAALVELVRRIDGDRLTRGVPFSGSASVFRHGLALGLPDLQVEQFRLLLLDGKHRLLEDVLISQGTLTSSPVHPREVFHPAIRSKAAAVVLLHNHPSGDPSPSADDLEITRRLVQVGDMVGIRVVDHVIIGQGTFCSLADRGVLR
jgi:DNA repair protein RadC